MWEKRHYAKCYGHWLVSDQECIRCAVSDGCEKRTKAILSDSVKKPEECNVSGESEHVEIKPVDYLVERLKGSFDHDKDEQEKAVIHKFSVEGKIHLAIVIGVLGKIKIISVLKKKEKIFGSIQSVQEAEEILKEML